MFIAIGRKRSGIRILLKREEEGKPEQTETKADLSVGQVVQGWDKQCNGREKEKKCSTQKFITQNQLVIIFHCTIQCSLIFLKVKSRPSNVWWY